MITSRRSLLAVALLLAVASSAAPAGAKVAAPSVVHRASVTVGGVRASADGTWLLGDGPTLALPRRARVVFTVPSKTQVLPFMRSMPKGAGRYVAFYLPSARWGWAELADPGSARGWPAELDFGDGLPWTTLVPGTRYTLLVALDRATRVTMPFPMHVVSVRTASFRAAAVVQPLPLVPGPSVAALGSTPNRLGMLPYVSTAVAIDWHDYVLPGGDTEGDACPAASETDAATCGSWGNRGYTIENSEQSLVGGPVQLVLGNASDRPAEEPAVVGYAATAPQPFDAVTLLGFAIDP